MSMSNLLKNVDGGFTKSAKDEGHTNVSYFALKAAEAGVGPDDRELERRCTDYEHRLDVKPWEHWRVGKARQLAYDTWAIDAAFKEHKVVTHGPGAWSVQKAWTTQVLQPLFPVWIDSRIIEGYQAMPILDALISESINVNQGVVEHIEILDEVAGDMNFPTLAGELTEMTEMTVRADGRTVKLKEKAAKLNISDKARERANLPLLSVFLRRFGRRIAIGETNEVIDVLTNPTGLTTVPAATTPATYADFVTLLLSFPEGAMPNVAVAHKDVWAAILNMPEVKDPLLWTFLRDGRFPAFLGWSWYRWDSTASSTYTGKDVLAIEREMAAVQYLEGGIRTEMARDPDKRMTTEFTSFTAGYAPLLHDARRLGTDWVA